MGLKAHVAGVQIMYTFGGANFYEQCQKHSKMEAGDFHFKGYPSFKASFQELAGERPA